MNAMNQVKILTFLFHIYNVFHSPEHTIHIRKWWHKNLVLNFKGADPNEDRGVLIPISLLKTNPHPSGFHILRTELRTQESGCRWQRVLPPRWRWLPVNRHPEGAAHGDKGLIRKSIYRYPRTCKYENMTECGLEHQVLAPNELCKFIIS